MVVIGCVVDDAKHSLLDDFILQVRITPGQVDDRRQQSEDQHLGHDRANGERFLFSFCKLSNRKIVFHRRVLVWPFRQYSRLFLVDRSCLRIDLL